MRRFPWLFAVAFLLLITVPHVTHAAGTVFTKIFDPSGICACDPQHDTWLDATTSPDYGCVVLVAQNAMNDFVAFATVMITIFIGYAGFAFILNPTNPEKRNQARRRVTNAVIGVLIVLVALLLVDSVMKVLYNPNASFTDSSSNTSTQLGPWNSILAPTDHSYCIQPQKTPTPLTGNAANGVPGSTVTATAGTSGAGGTCTVPSNDNDPCSIQSLSGTCFAASGSAASQVCEKESRGQAAILSGSDKLNKGSGPSYSVGLWQINLTTTPVAGLNCPAAFSNKCSGAAIQNQGKVGWCDSAIVNQDLYNRCVQAAQNPLSNSQAACSLYNSSLSAWKCSASRCSIPGASVMSGTCAPGT